ncbi:hypothetical protein CFOL_v3_04204 [Cephalotus follicularis]|uniref:Transmembrane protein n=1 Tax=Cephalotus follicularis TaxID=3775 RepID=A0A1Q3AYF4_CEPFO|nr:hypothetical protein CFOL_v3_04204 [Cephalotus follicularis]
MEALWKLEDKWKLSTQEALILLVCTAFAVIVICITTALKKKSQKKQVMEHEPSAKWSKPSCGWIPIVKVLMNSVRWSKPNKCKGQSIGGWEERQPPLLDLDDRRGDAGWQSHNSTAQVWQRPILMGEKCELPRFSGLILYDERGQLLNHSLQETSCIENTHQEKAAAVVRTTLKDLLYV